MLLSKIPAQSSIFMNGWKNTAQAALNTSRLKIAAIVAIIFAGITALFALNYVWKARFPESNSKESVNGQKTTDQIPEDPEDQIEKKKTSDQQGETTKKVEIISTTNLGKTNQEGSPNQSDQKKSELNFSHVKEESKEEKNTSMDESSDVDKPPNPSSDLLDTSLPNQPLNPPLNTVDTPSQLSIPTPISPPIDRQDPQWINAHPDVPLINVIDNSILPRSHSTDFLFLVMFLEKHGHLLTRLNLTGLTVDDDEFETIIKKVLNIEYLSLHSHKITDDALACLKGLPLKSIDLNCCELTEDGLAHLKGFQLTSAKFNGCKKLKNNALAHLKGMPLTSVEFRNCKKLTEKGIAHLKNMQLTSVKFGGCVGLTDEALAHLKGMALHFVEFLRCHQLTDNGLFHLKDMLLTGAHFGSCRQLTDDGIAHFKNMPLENAVFYDCKKLTDKIFDHFDGMPLRELNLNGCDQISDNAAAAFILKHHLVQDSTFKRLWKK